MKRVHLAVMVAVATAAFAVPAQERAGQSEQQQSVPVPYKAGQGAEQLRIDLPDRYQRMWPEEYDDYRGAYTLANGQTLSIAARGTAMYARVDDDRWHKIVVAAPHTFVALDRQLKLELNLLGDERVSGWVTMVVPARQLADGAPAPERVVRLAMR
jgi:hypothetical protein